MAPLPQAAIPVTVRVRPSLALSSVSEIELRYDGAQPPLELLADLARLGWEGASPCPPPAHAIDWTQPDVARGTRHTIRSFDALTTACLRGSDRHRAAGVEQARVLLVRHGLVADAATTTPDAAIPAHRPTGTSLARFELIVPPGLAADVRCRAGDLGTVELDEADVWTSSTTYRGNKTVQRHEARRFVVAVPSSRSDELLVAMTPIRPWVLRPVPG